MRGVGIAIVTHNSEAEVGACLDAALASRAEIVVVDNASTDQTRREVLRRTGVRLISNPWNRGFAAAANQAIDALEQPYVLLLNPDAVPLGGLGALVEALSERWTAAAGGKLVDELGRPQAGFAVRRFPSGLALALETLGVNRLWPGNPVNRRYRCLDLNLEAAAEVEQPAGAFMMIRRKVWQELGGFDELFHPLWFEDVDFCRRAREAGYRLRYVPSAVARHRGAHSAGKLSPLDRQLYWYDSLLKYAAKHLGLAARWVTCLAVVLRSVVRAIMGIFLLRGRQALSVHGRIIRLAARCLVSGRRQGGRLSPAYQHQGGSRHR